MELNDELVFVFGEVPSLEVRAEVIDPSEAAALAAPEEASGLGEGAPAALTMGSDVGDEPLILLLSPCPLVGVRFLAAWRPSHDS